jgi:hypothetical protein
MGNKAMLEVPEETAVKLVASLSVRMVTHMEFDTQIPQDMRRQLKGIFTPYWFGEITLRQLMDGMRLIGYGGDLDTDGLLEFINKGDLH